MARAGTYNVKLAYLTTGLAWKAAYVARLAPDSGRLDLSGWITLANHGDVGYAKAETMWWPGDWRATRCRLAARYWRSGSSYCHCRRATFASPAGHHALPGAG